MQTDERPTQDEELDDEVSRMIDPPPSAATRVAMILIFFWLFSAVLRECGVVMMNASVR